MLHIESYGNKCSPIKIVFLHGFLGSGLDWQEVIFHLKEIYHCLTIDLPSHGKSPRTENTLLALEKTLSSFSPFILVGYSMGGRISLAYANKNPDQITMALIVSGHPGLSSKDSKQEREKGDLLWGEQLTTLSSDQFLKLWYEQSVFQSLTKKPVLLASIVEKRKMTDPEGLSQVLQELSLSKQPFYHSFLKPTYFFFGEEDEKYKNLYTSLAISNTVGIEKAGHVVHLENPRLLATKIETLIQKEVHL